MKYRNLYLPPTTIIIYDSNDIVYGLRSFDLLEFFELIKQTFHDRGTRTKKEASSYQSD